MPTGGLGARKTLSMKISSAGRSRLVEGTCQVQTHPSSSVGAHLGAQTHILGYTTPWEKFQTATMSFWYIDLVYVYDLESLTRMEVMEPSHQDSYTHHFRGLRLSSSLVRTTSGCF